MKKFKLFLRLVKKYVYDSKLKPVFYKFFMFYCSVKYIKTLKQEDLVALKTASQNSLIIHSTKS